MERPLVRLGRTGACDHRTYKMSAFDFLSVRCRLASFSPPHTCSLTAGRFVSLQHHQGLLKVSFPLLSDLISSPPADRRVLLAFVYHCRPMFSVCILYMCPCVCLCMRVYCVHVCMKARGQSWPASSVSPFDQQALGCHLSLPL